MILTDADQLREALRLVVQERDAAQQRELEGMRERTALAREVESLRQQLEAAEAFHAVTVVEREAARAQAEQLRAELEGEWLKRSKALEADGARLLAGLAASSHARLRSVAEAQREACARFMDEQRWYTSRAALSAPLVTEAVQ